MASFWQIYLFTALLILLPHQQQQVVFAESEYDDGAPSDYDKQHFNAADGNYGHQQTPLPDMPSSPAVFVPETSGNSTPHSVDDGTDAYGEMNELRSKIKRMEGQIEQLKKENFSQCENNHWNAEDCHNELFLLQPDCLKIVCRGHDEFYRSVRAEFAAPKKFGRLYYEVKIVAVQRNYTRDIGIGLAPKSVPLNRTGIGKLNDTYAYFDDGSMLGHNIGGYSGNARFEAGDVIGCGIDLARQQIIYTKNGERLDTANMVVHSTDLYPAVSLRNPGDIVEANFGPNFRYNMPDTALSVRHLSASAYLMLMLGLSVFHNKMVWH